jgi:hypothetical protein
MLKVFPRTLWFFGMISPKEAAKNKIIEMENGNVLPNEADAAGMKRSGYRGDVVGDNRMKTKAMVKADNVDVTMGLGEVFKPNGGGEARHML